MSGARRGGLLVAALVLGGCTEETIVLASVQGQRGLRESIEVRCVDNGDCPPNAYCEKASCGELAGTCVAAPPACPVEEHPVCGCDGITYPSDCLRRAAQVTASENHPCKPPIKTCAEPSSANRCP